MTSVEKLADSSQPTAEQVQEQLRLLTQDRALRSSKRLVCFLQFVVAQVLNGSADQLKERTIGAAVFDRPLDYDTNNDHIVRTAASELRKRLAVYYHEEAHRFELRIDLPAGSYVPQFTLPGTRTSETGVETRTSDPSPAVADSVVPPREVVRKRIWIAVTLILLMMTSAGILYLRNTHGSESEFWNPVIRDTEPALIVIGDLRSGSPAPAPDGNADSPPSPNQPAPGFPKVSTGDAYAIARIASVLGKTGKTFSIRKESSTSFSDLQAGPVILVGLFSNDWSLRLLRSHRFSLALDSERHLIYILDRQNPEKREWSVAATDQIGIPTNRANGRPLRDYALISRTVNSETGKVVVVVGGLYMYGTQAAGDFFSDPQLGKFMASLQRNQAHQDLQIVLETDVTEGIPGPCKIVAYSVE